MRATGGNFVNKLADAMEVADPVNYSILVKAFPVIVEKYSNAQSAPARGNVS